MIFVVDSGSTKTDWIALDNLGEVLFSTQTLGLNPQVLPSAILNERIINNYDLFQNRNKVSHIYFYGAGCGVETPKKRIERVFKEIHMLQFMQLLLLTIQQSFVFLEQVQIVLISMVNILSKE